MKSKKIYIISALIVLITIAFIGYFKSSNKNYNGTLEDNTGKSEYLAYFVNDVPTSTMPNSGDYYVNAECLDRTGNAVNVVNDITWDSTNTTWKISLKNISSGSVKCNIYFTAKQTWANPASGTLLYAIKNDPLNTIQTLGNDVIPGLTVSTEQDAFMSSAPDDYGTSYYFRGAVQNNYVKFAGMCWRIVRVTGSSEIKMVVYNYSGTNCSSSGTNYAFPRVLGSSNGSLAWHTARGTNTYLGYMFGDASSNQYGLVHANVNVSNHFAGVMAWYDSKFSSKQQRLLADVIWCNDIRKGAKGSGVGTSATNYAAYYRLDTSTGTGASLICSNDSNEGNLTKFTARQSSGGNGDLTYNNKEYKAGVLTIDEVAYAGATMSDTNNTYYLYDNASAGYWFTMTPRYFSGGARMFCGGSDGKITDINTTTAGRFRPAVALISSAKITGGDGQKATPYVIDES